MVERRAVFRPDRRAFLTAASALLAAGFPLQARAARAKPRLAAIDWAMLETAVAIGHMPVAACELIRFREDAISPAIPDDVVDLGLRGAPNFELLQLTRPDLILTSPYYIRYQTRLQTLAPVVNLPFYTPQEPPLPKAVAALHTLAEAVEDDPAGDRAADRAQTELDQLARRLRPFSDRPVALVHIGDARHVQAFGHDSLFGSTLTRLALQNAWNEATAFSFMAPVPLERLASMHEARLVIVGQIPPPALHGLRRSVLWRALPPVAGGRLYLLPDVNAFGAVPAALRFARLLTEAFEAGPMAWT
ncbi:iron-siderophore ABC transporter substrate-binding protein [Paracoccus fistulariae]|uniref:Iron-siderophore ABC transporter substrate-binding protein n=1 Tax=Paracoccus fistulariae TaxID=658446 RepID=A0ABY7SNH5_9RHOB|nr:iron-siderophore ABC transporter substrate-binding protein [Paracoccus fistulariae]MDB6180376.1 iron-siderophore ABC transporter substrate-binding protein [Paracoccus fistulariae]WCR08455.1 iron-siderophore ABC transporter substrate-binding protein [Paracoccus fistulariae]